MTLLFFPLKLGFFELFDNLINVFFFLNTEQVVCGGRYVPGHVPEYLVPLAQHRTESGFGITGCPLRLLSAGGFVQSRQLVGSWTARGVPVVDGQPGAVFADVVDGIAAEHALHSGRSDLRRSPLDGTTATLHLARTLCSTAMLCIVRAVAAEREDSRARLTKLIQWAEQRERAPTRHHDDAVREWVEQAECAPAAPQPPVHRARQLAREYACDPRKKTNRTLCIA